MLLNGRGVSRRPVHVQWAIQPIIDKSITPLDL